MASEVQPIKRIVLIQRTGRLAGLWYIDGTDEQLPGLPMWIDGIRFYDGHTGTADYLRTTERAHIYQERLEA
jgi:hypothetical protein